MDLPGDLHATCQNRNSLENSCSNLENRHQTFISTPVPFGKMLKHRLPWSGPNLDSPNITIPQHTLVWIHCGVEKLKPEGSLSSECQKGWSFTPLIHSSPRIDRNIRMIPLCLKLLWWLPQWWWKECKKQSSNRLRKMKIVVIPMIFGQHRHKIFQNGVPELD